MEKVFVRSMYNYDRDKVSNETGLLCEDESLAIQSERDDSDINTIVKRFGLTGELPSGVRAPTYGDFTGIGTFQQALEAVRQAEDAFMAMPAEIRKRFGDNPEEFVQFCSDPANGPELVKMGLAIEIKGPEAKPADRAPAEDKVPPKGGTA